MSAKVKRRMDAKCESSTLPMCPEVHSTDMGEIKVKNNAADAIPEGGENRFPSKMERRGYARYSREKGGKSVQSKKEDK
ncbi:uncharacterized protein N7479_007765 [Penicillium vulpinum]|uniref:uncharacterized protein n=1 Tax=Penicillium vulpinum TaxID=29845 RepID=UPI002546EAC3|nr:uncharacterized protein N7479_007765 [Penicillium vulpinum]KAJ5960615.1 hypothetical protein N7479_007765 [Penicillium vulpinum]